MRFDNNAFYAVEDGLAASSYQGILRIIDGIGEFSRAQGKTLDRILPHEIQDKLKSQEQGFMSMHSDDVYLASAMIDKNRRSILYLQKLGSSTVLQRKLLDIYSNNVLIAFQNIHLMEDIDKAQQEMVYLLAEAIETRSQETGFHLQRVAELSLLLAKGLNLDEDLAMKIHRSSPLHDLGKIAIPDEILNKPGKLTSEEFEKMKAHSQIGHDMIIESERELCQTGRLIALEHHERWDGAGYPNGKKGKDISIEGRITAVADVFDALSAKRCYKDAWSLDDVFKFMKDNSGSQFDPQIIKILLNHEDDIRAIYHQYSV